MKWNFVVILKDGEAHFEEVKKLSSFEPDIIVSDKGWIAMIGGFKENEIKQYEYYLAGSDWQTKAGWKDRPL